MQTQIITNIVPLIFKLFLTKILGKLLMVLKNLSKIRLTKYIPKH